MFLALLQPTISSELSGVTPTDIQSTDYPLCYLLRYFNRLPCVLCSTLSSDTITDSPLCFACRYSNRLSVALPCLSILHLTIRSTVFPLCSLWLYFNRLYTLTTIRSILSGVTLTDYAVWCTTLSGDTPTDYPLYRRSDLLSLELLQSPICSDLLDVSILPPTFLCALFHSV
jgi:hypothetical protein